MLEIKLLLLWCVIILTGGLYEKAFRVVEEEEPSAVQPVGESHSSLQHSEPRDAGRDQAVTSATSSTIGSPRP